MDNIFFNNANADLAQTKTLAKVYPSARVVNLEKKPTTTVCNDVELNETKQQQQQKDEETDESALFGELVVVRLRNLPQRTRKILMHQIDDLIFKTEMAEMDALCNNNSAEVPMKTAMPSTTPSSSFGCKMEA